MAYVSIPDSVTSGGDGRSKAVPPAGMAGTLPPLEAHIAAHRQQAQQMVLAASLAAAVIIAVAATMLSRLF